MSIKKYTDTIQYNDNDWFRDHPAAPPRRIELVRVCVCVGMCGYVCV